MFERAWGNFMSPLYHLDNLTGAAMRVFRPQGDGPLHDGAGDPLSGAVSPLPGLKGGETACAIRCDPA
jgi:hypothetical protein